MGVRVLLWGRKREREKRAEGAGRQLYQAA